MLRFKQDIWIQKNDDTFNGTCSRCDDTISFIESLILLKNKSARGSEDAINYDFICHGCDDLCFLNNPSSDIESIFYLKRTSDQRKFEKNKIEDLNTCKNQSDDFFISQNKSYPYDNLVSSSVLLRTERVLKTGCSPLLEEDFNYDTLNEFDDIESIISTDTDLSFNFNTENFQIETEKNKLINELEENINYNYCYGEKHVVFLRLEQFDGVVNVANFNTYRLLIDTGDSMTTSRVICIGFADKNNDYQPLTDKFVANVVKEFSLKVLINGKSYYVDFNKE